MQFQQETRASIQSLTNQMGQMATQLNQAQSQNSNKLPSQSVQNPKNVSAIILRSGKQYQGPQPVASSLSANEPAQPHSTPEKDDDKNLKSKLPTKFYAGESFTGNFDLQKQRIPLPFPPREISNKKWKRQRRRS